MRISAIVFLFGVLVVSAFGCEKGRYTDDHHYVGNPERLPATSEAVAPKGVSSSGTKEPANNRFQ
ncbi:MAG TPA: hypothetical protein VJV04_06855 [Nitrospiraceae bacterium]|nr:hypothetical protein [Nitrospiraceae bacterium]